MQATAFGILKTQVQTNMGKAIIRNHQDSLDTRAAMSELVAHCRTSTRAIAIGHALHQELLTMRVTKDVHVSRHDFPSSQGDTMCNCLEHTHGREEAQTSQSQLLSCLQETVSLDRDLNRLRHDQMLCMLQGKTTMALTQCMDALTTWLLWQTKLPQGRRFGRSRFRRLASSESDRVRLRLR
jgi:hypothetical protein